MHMKDYLLETFRYNDVTNKKMLAKIMELTDKDESIKLFSHLINSQYKWMARIIQDAKAPGLSWWDPVYNLAELKEQWSKSLQLWVDYVSVKTEAELGTEVEFVGFDGGRWAATPLDIALQLNYHSIHHRAQIQTIIRQHGLEPDFVDYIGTQYRKIN
ncbi:DinB family protein [Ferruginibacter paludis]|uniref:DinB family protein n=1 Tax=Ferruginibacter paludis TaxID=1310417 RepID=UPI0025B28609|nr:DinB family protein [Ferruginibacter paludis]MDN3659203.1 DinB family protein [Ferruginibacter paludis]